MDLYVESDAPLGTGLGTSSALVVAFVGAFSQLRGHTMTKHDVANLAWEIERRDLGISGGLQDQYASSYGGVNLMEFHGSNDVEISQLKIDADVLSRLEYSLLLVYTGSRASKDTISDQLTRYERGDDDVTDAIDRIKSLTLDARDAILSGHPDTLGEILHETWVQKKRTSPLVTTPRIDEMYEEARRFGAIGGKVCGAGSGGYIFLYCPFDSRLAVAQRMMEMSGEISPFRIACDGLRSWLWSL